MSRCRLLLSAGGRKVDGFVRANFLCEQTQLIGIVPVHPVSEPDRLLGLSRGEGEDAAFALVHKVVDAVFVDGGLCAQAQLFFDLDLNPQSLAVEAVLVPLVVAHHREESLVGVLVGAAPGVVDAHRIVCGDRPVEEAPARPASVSLTQLLEDFLILPELQSRVLTTNEIGVFDFLEHVLLDFYRARIL